LVNLYNASKEALAEMRAGNYHHVKLEIEHSPTGKTRWIFTKLPETFTSKVFDAAHTFFSMMAENNHASGPLSEFKFGDEIRQFHEEGEAFHQKMQRALSKVSLLGKDSTRMKKEGFSCCIQDRSYWCETLNSLHISKPVYNALQNRFKLAKQETPDLDFDTWIKTDDAIEELESHEGTRDISEFQVRYLTPMQRAEHLVTFRKEGNDTFLSYQGKPLNTEHFSTEAGDGRAIFVIGPNHELYAGSHEYCKFHHTSFFGGKPVIGAGEIITDPNGKLIAITDKSGHYKPQKKHMFDTLRVLKEEKGVDLEQITLILVPKAIMKKHGESFSGRYNAQSYYETKGSIAPNDLKDEDYR
jgi:hypothetical protein